MMPEKLEKFLNEKEKKKTENEKSIQIAELIDAMRNDARTKHLFSEFEAKRIEQERIERDRRVFFDQLRELNTKARETLEKYRNETERIKKERSLKLKEFEKIKNECDKAEERYRMEKTRQTVLREQARNYLIKTAPKELSRAGKVIYKLIEKDAYRDAIHDICVLTPEPKPSKFIETGYYSDMKDAPDYREVSFQNEKEVNDLGIRMKSAYEEFLNDMCSIENIPALVEKWEAKGKAFQEEYEKLRNEPCIRETVPWNKFTERVNEIRARGRKADKNPEIKRPALFGII